MLVERRCTSSNEVAQWVREVHDNGQSGQSIKSTSSIKSTYPEIAANAALALTAAACSLLDRQLAAQSEASEQDGGFTERLYQRRTQARRR